MGKEKIECQDRSFTSLSILTALHEEMWYQCSEGTCRRSYTTEGSLQRHVKWAHQESRQQYTCTKEDCKKVFLNQCTLRNHLQKDHSTYTCTFKNCLLEFTDTVAYQTHLASHRSYKCSHISCVASFGAETHLKRHVREQHITQQSFPSSDATGAVDSMTSPEPMSGYPYGKISTQWCLTEVEMQISICLSFCHQKFHFTI